MISDQKKQLAACNLTSNLRYYRGGNESAFFIYHEPSMEPRGAHGCREVFSRIFKRNCIVGFTGNRASMKRANRLFDIVHERLGIENQIVFFPTNQPKTFLIKVPHWWTTNSLRKQFFSLFLRMSLYFNKDFSEAENGYALSKSIKRATKLFFDGYTQCRKGMVFVGHDGIVHHFSKKSKAEILEMIR